LKTLPAPLAAHLARGATTLAYCWRLTRRDGGVLGFTEHDRDIICDGTTFRAASGFAASQIQQALGLSIDNLTASGALSSASITEGDILAGRYDDAGIELLWVNWSDPTQRLTIEKGSLGEIERHGVAFVAELRSLSHRLNQKIGGIYQRTCSATLGDSKCRIDVTKLALRGVATTQSAGTIRQMRVSGLSGFAPDWFTDGTFAFTRGANASLTFEIKSHIRTGGADFLELWMPTPFPVAIGDVATVAAGCRKNFHACRSKFGNQANFRGFPHIPGADVVTLVGMRGAPDQTGGSRLGN
jgi:uncharacterized phage protein (TIGR02218 family)